MNSTTTRFNQTAERLNRTGFLNEPAGYVDGKNLYEYIKGNPLSGTDPLGLQSMAPPSTRPTGGIENMFDRGIESNNPFDYIAAQAATLGWVNQSLGKEDQSKIAGFVNAQIAILNALAKGGCPCLDDAEKMWLENTVRDFMRPFIRSLWERSNGKPISDAGWNGVFKGIDSGAYKNVKYPSPTLNAITPEPLDFVPEIHATAREMALNHIQNDLKRSLQKNGLGRDALWDCIGKIVDKESKELLIPHQQLGMQLVGWWDAAWNVGEIREQMRDALKPTTLPTTSPAR